MSKQNDVRRMRAGTGALVLIAVGLGAAPARGAIIHFENPAGPGHFTWAGAAGSGFRYIDLTLGAASQPGVASRPSSIGQTVVTAGNLSRLTGNVRNQVTTAPPGGAGAYAVVAPAGTPIPFAGFSWATGTNNIQHATFGGWIPEGQEVYLSVAFDADGPDFTPGTPGVDCNYGWIKVVRTGLTLDALAWAYESQVETPIIAGAIPAPGAAGLLGLGALAAVRRRR